MPELATGAERFFVAVVTILFGVIYLLLGVAPLVVFLTVVVSLSGFLTAVLLMKRRLDVSTEKALKQRLLNTLQTWLYNGSSLRLSSSATFGP